MEQEGPATCGDEASRVHQPRWAAQRIHPRRLARGHLAPWAHIKAWAIAAGHPARGKTVAARTAGLGFAALTV
ncbi:hypothetical protein ACFWOS_16040 [Streptomyces rubiginosohelvolus]|uniref:hypothetical protein n=1 Tax=Streptomyces rubiginosohelvolus TaxID=67362 RepID=UPI0036683298